MASCRSHETSLFVGQLGHGGPARGPGTPAARGLLLPLHLRERDGAQMTARRLTELLLTEEGVPGGPAVSSKVLSS